MLSLALPGESWAHRLPAGVKMAALCLVMLAVFPLGRPLPLALCLLAVVALYASLGPLALRRGGRALRGLAPVLALILGYHLLTGAPRLGAVVVLRVLVMMGLATLVTLTTRLDDMVAVVARLAAPLGRFGLDPRLPGLAVALAVRFVPVLIDRGAQLALAWRARARRRPGPRLLVPLVLSALDDADHVADALRARGGLTPRQSAPGGRGTDRRDGNGT